jgi:S-adenosylmethionine decarboxylase
LNPYFFLNQVIGDYWGCKIDENCFNSPDFMVEAAKQAIEYSNSTLIKYIDHKFVPQGYTLLMVLADSSLILHSWPEEQYICVEIFTCTEKSNPIKGLKYLRGKFKPEKFEIHNIERK